MFQKHSNDIDLDFLALEMVERRIRLVWNVGGGTQILTHPMTLQPSPDDLTHDSRWYKIEAKRYFILNYFIVDFIHFTDVIDLIDFTDFTDFTDFIDFQYLV